MKYCIDICICKDFFLVRGMGGGRKSINISAKVVICYDFSQLFALLSQKFSELNVLSRLSQRKEKSLNE